MDGDRIGRQVSDLRRSFARDGNLLLTPTNEGSANINANDNDQQHRHHPSPPQIESSADPMWSHVGPPSIGDGSTAVPEEDNHTYTKF